MRFAVILMAGLLTGLGSSAAAAQSLTQKAELWGELHAAAIYCRSGSSEAFGHAAMAYLKRRAANAAEFNRLRDIYGVKAVTLALKPPTRAAGGSCYGFNHVYQEAWKVLRGH